MYQVVDNATASATQTNTFPPKIFEKKKESGWKFIRHHFSN